MVSLARIILKEEKVKVHAKDLDGRNNKMLEGRATWSWNMFC